jgi:uridylate kinase
MASRPLYRRVLLKISGEALQGSQKFGVDPDAALQVATSVKELTDMGVQVALVTGGGNIFRGIRASKQGMERTPADHIGMLATLINGIALQQSFEKISVETRIMSSITCDVMAELYNWKQALKYLDQGLVLIFVGGTGNPYFTTDSAASLRALEIKADVLLKATKVDGIYDKDPLKYNDAVKFNHISYSDVLAKNLEVMDAAAIALCRENGIPIRVFDIFADHALKNAVCDKAVGTTVEGK